MISALKMLYQFVRVHSGMQNVCSMRVGLVGITSWVNLHFTLTHGRVRVLKRFLNMSTVRRRPLHEGGVDGEEKDPLVADDNGDQWDLDDEGWGEESGEKVQTRDEDGELTRRRKILRRSTREVSTAFVCHLVLMCLYVYIHVHDATIFKRNKGKGFVGAFTYGGRWKFLTYINMVSSTNVNGLS